MAVESPRNPSLAEIEHAHGHDQSGHLRIYRNVFFSLLLFTIIEYFYAHWFKNSFATLVLGLMTWAIIKAVLVGLYFMHLKYEGRWVYAMLVPSGILAVVLVAALMPDIAMQPVVEMNRNDDDSAETAAPLSHSPGPANSGMAKEATPATAGSSH